MKRIITLFAVAAAIVASVSCQKQGPFTDELTGTTWAGEYEYDYTLPIVEVQAHVKIAMDITFQEDHRVKSIAKGTVTVAGQEPQTSEDKSFGAYTYAAPEVTITMTSSGENLTEIGKVEGNKLTLINAAGQSIVFTKK